MHTTSFRSIRRTWTWSYRAGDDTVEKIESNCHEIQNYTRVSLGRVIITDSNTSLIWRPSSCSPPHLGSVYLHCTGMVLRLASRAHTGFLSVLLLVCLCLPSDGSISWHASPFNAPSLPLAVKTPYLNAWLPQGGHPSKSGQIWPCLWTGIQTNVCDSPYLNSYYDLSFDYLLHQNLGWTGIIKVDAKTYAFLGDATDPEFGLASEISVEFTATQTIFIFQAGPVDLNVSFLSPITVNHFAFA